jgi:hypothetical protein
MSSGRWRAWRPITEGVPVPTDSGGARSGWANGPVGPTRCCLFLPRGTRWPATLTVWLPGRRHPVCNGWAAKRFFCA